MYHSDTLILLVLMLFGLINMYTGLHEMNKQPCFGLLMILNGLVLLVLACLIYFIWGFETLYWMAVNK